MTDFFISESLGAQGAMHSQDCFPCTSQTNNNALRECNKTERNNSIHTFCAREWDIGRQD